MRPHPTARVLMTFVAVLTVAFTCLALGAAPASAGHSQLLSTSPADGSVLAAPPPEVVFTFDAPLLPDTPTVSINDADGQVVSSIHPAPDGDSVAIPWPEGTSPGDYQVAFRVVCADGQPLIGAITLTITGAGAAGGSASASPSSPSATTPATTQAASPAAAAPTATPAKGLPIAAILVVAAGVALVALAAIVVSGRRRRTSAGATGPGPLH